MVIRAVLSSAAAVACKCCSGYSLSVSKQSLAGWGAGGVLLAFNSQSEATGVFGQVEQRRQGLAILVCVCGGGADAGWRGRMCVI